MHFTAVLIAISTLSCTDIPEYISKLSKPIPEPEVVVVINGRSFNYDPRDRIGLSAYQRGLQATQAHQMIAPNPENNRWHIRRTTDPVLALARICVSEEGFNGTNGCRAIAEVARNVRSRSCDNTQQRFRRHQHITQCSRRNGEPFDVRPGTRIPNAQETLLSAMRRLSRHVTGLVEPSRSRQHWTSTLSASTARPVGWVECTGENTPRECNGRWEHYTERWEQILNLSKELVSTAGQVCPRPNDAHGPVITWGGDMDRWLAERRGLIEVDCGDTANIYYAQPRANRPERTVQQCRLSSQQSDGCRMGPGLGQSSRPRQTSGV